MIFDPEHFEHTVGNTFAHDVNLATALKIGRQMDASIMPEWIRFVAIEVEELQIMSESMTPKVEAAVAPAADAVLYLMDSVKDQSC